MIVFEMRKLLKCLLLLLSIIVVNVCRKTNNETAIIFQYYWGSLGNTK